MRNLVRFPLGLMVFWACIWSNADLCRAEEPTWVNRVIKTGTDREQSENTDILLRPYRPLHFVGNSVRRKHYRGVALPNARDIGSTVVHLVAR